MDNKQLEQRITELENKIKSLTSSTTIPLEIDGAFRKRFDLNNFSKVLVSSKSATSENKNAVMTVNFSGETVTTDSVLDNPDGFLQVNINGTVYYLPYYV